jgi:iron complex outermembrane receptor protein
MPLTTRLGFATAIAVTVLTCALVRPAAAQTGKISGTVSDSTRSGLAGVDVRVDGTFLHGISDDRGHFEISGVPAGTYTVRALLMGYRPATQSVTVGVGAAAEANFTLGVSPVQMQGVEVMLGSRARHTAADELAVPVDVYDSEQLQRQGTTETSQALQGLSPSVNFPHQSVTDATDVVRPFTLRGLSPDHTLVLLDGWRRHQTALINTFAYGTNAGSSGVDLNAIPSSAIDRIEVLRDGASAEYGSDAIAGVVNIVPRGGRFAPFVNATGGQYMTPDYSNDGKTFDVNGGWGLGLGRGSLGIFAQALDREPTNRAWADPFEESGTGVADVVGPDGKVIVKNNPVPQPNYHWGDGLERDVLTLANLRLPLDDSGHQLLYGTGGYSFRRGSGQGYRRYASDNRNWPQIYPLGFLPEFHPDVTDYSVNGGLRTRASDWRVDVGGSFGHNDFEYNLRNTLNSSLGPSLTTPTAPGPDTLLGTADDPGIPNQTSFFAGRMSHDEIVGGVGASTVRGLGLPAPVSIALGTAIRWEKFQIERGELASYINGWHRDQDGGDPVAGSQVFAGFSPTDESSSNRTNIGAYADLESNLSPQLLANVAARFENYSDFGSLVTGKLAMRYQPAARLVFRAAASNGFRAPGLGQIHFSKIVTNVISGVPEQVGVFPVDNPVSQLLGSKPLDEERSVNLSGGMAVTPVNGLTLALDYFNITINDRIVLGATFDDSLTRAILAGAGHGDISGVQYFTNGLDTRTQGVDLTADIRVPMGGAQSLTFNASANYTKNKITHVDPLPPVLANSTEPGILDVVTRVAIEKERPDWRGMLTGNYENGRVHSMARISYYGKFSSAQPGYCDDCEETYGGKTLVDAELGYHVSALDLSIGSRNLFDVYPDHPKLDFNNNFGVFPFAAASPFGYNGRYLYTRASIVLPR